MGESDYGTTYRMYLDALWEAAQRKKRQKPVQLELVVREAAQP